MTTTALTFGAMACAAAGYVAGWFSAMRAAERIGLGVRSPAPLFLARCRCDVAHGDDGTPPCDVFRDHDHSGACDRCYHDEECHR